MTANDLLKACEEKIQSTGTDPRALTNLLYNTILTCAKKPMKIYLFDGPDHYRTEEEVSRDDMHNVLANECDYVKIEGYEIKVTNSSGVVI